MWAHIYLYIYIYAIYIYIYIYIYRVIDFLQAVNEERRVKTGTDKQTGIRREIYLYTRFQGNLQAYNLAMQAGAFLEKVDKGGNYWCLERSFEASDTTSFEETAKFEGAVQLCSYVITKDLCSDT